MKDKKRDIVAKAVESLKNDPVPPGPPQDLLDQTLKNLAASTPKSPQERPERSNCSETVIHAKKFFGLTTKIAAAAVLCVLTGYSVGRLSAPRAPDIQQLHDTLEKSLTASLEPAIRQRLLEDIGRHWQIALADSCAQLKDELTVQYRADLNRFAMQTLAASNNATNHLLAQLVQAINTTKTQDMRRIAAAIYQIENNRLEDTTQLASGLERLALQTEDQWQRTREDMARLMVDKQAPDLYPQLRRLPDNQTERSPK